ncbi:Hpt domain-containing protein [Roseivirga ehrenbergii]|uniref:HPt domain-containing protein n=1 Tax=Roseivirga ehrenbergii (strain DSM 102268 / JCM 13514 / KCTC 12282 / NCIMB 14502 / KMM 6017) TaxID=279360 RepID=A0A150X8E5_ROSEK|nr:Hpt domain-containing protein [Roseivirga ehrenbergii]KYG74932.1 hypothetical protein MB14_06940 [Roseivirga ehrenbergii]TCL13727.1 Hpt domain-containing protein [Roseivirga ehrenbergii]
MKPNLNYIKQLANGNATFENRILGVLKRELPEEIDGFRNSINSLDYALAAMLVHKIKHKVSLLGMEDGYKLTADFEDELREGAKSLQDDFEGLLKIMTTFLNSINTETE